MVLILLFFSLLTHALKLMLENSTRFSLFCSCRVFIADPYIPEIYKMLKLDYTEKMLCVTNVNSSSSIICIGDTGASIQREVGLLLFSTGLLACKYFVGFCFLSYSKITHVISLLVANLGNIYSIVPGE